jgi:hypothetical protein
MFLPAWYVVASGSEESAVQSSSTRSPTTPVVNPHWSTDRCQTCHVDGRFDDIDRDLLQQPENCLACHNGKLAAMERHPIGRTFASPQIRKPDHWPTPDGRLACVTCHDVTIACRQPQPRSAGNPNFLRPPVGDHSGAVSNQTAFCASCHVPPARASFNPHQMLTPDDTLIESSCGFCHGSEMNRSSRNRTGNAHLITPEPLLCLGCHREHNDYFEPGHIGTKMPETMLEELRNQPPDPSAGVTSPLNHIFPPDEDGRMVCSTCHNPHQVGLFPRESVLSLGGMTDVKGGSALRLPASQFCAACHGF